MVTILLLLNTPSSLVGFRYELIKSLIDLGYSVYASSPYGEEFVEFEKMGGKPIETPMKRKSINPFHDICLLFKYIKIIKFVNPDVVLTFTIKPNVYGGLACRILKVPYVSNITGLGSAVENGGLMKKLVVILYKLSMKRASGIFFQNEENQYFFRDHNINPSVALKLPGSGVNLHKFSPIDYPDSRTVEFIFISRILKQKGIEQYLEAAKYIHSKYSQTRFHVVGPMEDAYSKTIEENHNNGIIQYHGPQKDVRPYLARCHCLIHPSFYPEGLSTVILESEACARPVITTDKSGCREPIDDGVTGFIIKQQNTQDLIEKIEYFISLPFEAKKQMGVAARQNIEKKYDRQIVVNSYLLQIDKIVKK